MVSNFQTLIVAHPTCLQTAAANTVSKTKDRAATRRFQKSKKQAQRSSNWKRQVHYRDLLAICYILHQAPTQTMLGMRKKIPGAGIGNRKRRRK